MSKTDHSLSSEAVYRIAHDLSAPFRQISEITDFVVRQHGDLPIETLELLRVVSNQGGRASDMLEGLVTLCDAELAVPIKKMVSASELADHFPFPCRISSAQADLQLDVDPRLLKLAVEELVDNARRYGEHTEVVVRRVGSALSIQVEESLFGLSQTQWEAALLPFSRLDAPENPELLGLGLPRAKIWSRLAGGRLELLSSGVGVCVPLAGSSK